MVGGAGGGVVGGLGGLIHYVSMNTKYTVSDSPRYHVLLEIHMYMHVQRGLGTLEQYEGGSYTIAMARGGRWGIQGGG